MKLNFLSRPALFAAASTAVLAWTAAAKDFILVRDNKPEAVIVRDPGSSGMLDRHIQFFNTELNRCTKTVLPVVKTAKTGQNKIIFRLEKQPVLKEDAFTIDFPDARTLRITGTETSVRWAFNHLLEQEIGIRWLLVPLKGLYGPEINHYPQLKTAAVKIKTFSDRPGAPFSRRPDWHIDGTNWNAKTKIRFVHMLVVDVFPVYKYAADNSWPQAILPVINGKKLVMKKARTPLPDNPAKAKKGYDYDWQPCWSNPETTRIAIENILEILQKDPDKQIINMAVNDCGGYCECAACRKAVAGKINLSRYSDYSVLYWTWVNNVAKAVAKKHPDVIFSAIAYREVLTPPPFKLHPNILPRLCLELASMIEPKWYQKRIKLVKDWSEKASMLDLYDYMHGLQRFYLPRIYFRSHSKILSELIRNYKLRSAYFESDGQTAFRGPLQQLMLKVLWDPDLDVEAFLNDWCEHAVGKKAAPHLMEYYRRWEDYWTGTEIRKTAWYSSVDRAYMQLGEVPTHLYALKKGDMQKFRELMEKVVSLAETPEQKKRAQVLMQAFEYSELSAAVVFAEIFPPDGRLGSAEKALELVNALPASIRAREKLAKHPLVRFRDMKNLTDAADASIGKVIPFLKDKRIRAKIEKLAADPAMPAILRAQFKIWFGCKAKNLIGNGSFEKETPVLQPLWMRRLNGRRDMRHVSDGQYSFRTGNGYYLLNEKIESGKTYLFLCDVYIEKGSGEGRFSYHLAPSSGKSSPRGWIRQKDIVLSGGVWNTCSAVVTSKLKGVDSLHIRLYFQKFEKDEPVWIDNLRLYCLDELVPDAKQNQKP